MPAKKLKALANPNRLKILMLLNAREQYLSEIRSSLELSAAGTLFHLLVLQKQGFVTISRRHGRVSCRSNVDDLHGLLTSISIADER